MNYSFNELQTKNLSKVHKATYILFKSLGIKEVLYKPKSINRSFLISI